MSTAYLDEAQRCSEVYMLNEGRLLIEGSPAFIQMKAQGCVFTMQQPAGQSARTLQAHLLDCKAIMADAVPQSGKVRLVLKKPIQPIQDMAHSALPTQDNCAIEVDLSNLPGMLDLPKAIPEQPRLEDGFMLLLREQNEAQQQNQFQAPTPNWSTSPLREAKSVFDNETIIEVHDLIRKFGDFTAVDHTSFKVAKGEVFGLLGPNGAGKTTTFRMLCGLLAASGGSLRVAGVDLRTARAQARRNIGYVAQKFSLYGNLTVKENLSFFGGVYGLHGSHLRRRMETVLSEFDLEGSHAMTTGNLPGGFKRRLAMAAALLHEPEILFLDEATSGADPLARREFWRRITSLAHSGVTVVVTTHFMEEAEYCDRIVIQDAGRVLTLGTPDQVRMYASKLASSTHGGQMSPDHVIDMEQAFIHIVESARAATHQGVTTPTHTTNSATPQVQKVAL
jgi:ABC-2 type transport system ATP-binding protein